MSDLKFSIIVPVYDVEDYLRRCIDSLINQSYTNIEIILVNDGSQDKSPQICTEYADSDNRIQVINKRNGGLSDARNFGLKAAKGEFIMFVDSDDYVESDACERFNDIIIKNQGIDIVASNIKGVKGKELKKEMYTLLEENKIINSYDFLRIQLQNSTMFMSACRNIYRRLLLIENELYFKVGIYHEDEQWTPRVFLDAKKIICTEYVHYNRVIREGSITRQKVKVKHSIDIINTVKELSNIYDFLDDLKLKLLLKDYLVMLYLNAFYVGRLHQKKFRKYIDKKFLKENALTAKNLRKTKLFCFNIRIYYLVNKLSKTIKHLV